MAGETGTIKQFHHFKDPLSEGLMKENNPDMYDSRMPRLYPTHRLIYIYSVAKRDFVKSHVYFKGVLRGCKAGERYVHCCSIPDPPQQISIDAERGGKRVDVEPRDEAGWRVAIDILNPNNPSTDPYMHMDGKTTAYYAIGQNVDLVRYGLFPSLNNLPTEEELLRAEKARDKSYGNLVDEAFQEQASNPQLFRRWLREHPDINVAMEALGVKADWSTKVEVQQACPNCGDSVKAGVAFHRSSAGVLCIIDPERAAKAGVKADSETPRQVRPYRRKATAA